MKSNICPICYNEMEIRDVTPCHVCGGWGDLEETIQTRRYSDYRLESGQIITLCYGCYLDELLSLQGDLVDYLGIRKSKHTAEGYTHTEELAKPSVGKDKYCVECQKRFKLIKLHLKLREDS